MPYSTHHSWDFLCSKVLSLEFSDGCDDRSQKRPHHLREHVEAMDILSGFSHGQHIQIGVARNLHEAVMRLLQFRSVLNDKILAEEKAQNAWRDQQEEQ